ncbi:winged helix DNA-binding protein [Paenibacillus sp. sgz500958]|uniref:winged helix DNA-binding protein n=1 Tax=Paenibacillus sp. sgz500958 TaxID=3242475 RepID=UPI0036D272C0
MNQPSEQPVDTIIDPVHEMLTRELMDTVQQMIKKFQNEDDEERQWLMEHCGNPVIIKLLEDLTVMMLHVIDAVGHLEPVNGITISKQFGIPKGSVSKITRKLVEKDILRTENLQDNKKEVLFSTTPLGKEIFILHQALHRQMDKGIRQFLIRYTSEELQFLVRSMKDTLNTSWVYPEKAGEEALPDEGSVSKGNTSSTSAASDLNEITSMLMQLNSRDLKKAKSILADVFFTDYDR